MLISGLNTHNEITKGDNYAQASTHISEIVAIRKHEQNIVFNQHTTYNSNQNAVSTQSANILSNFTTSIDCNKLILFYCEKK